MLLNLFQSLARFLVASIAGLFLLSTYAVAQVEVNSADQTALESVRGLGPSKAKAILAERKKNGPFKDANDLHTRVKGIGEKTVERMMQNGLTINNKGVAGAKTEKPVKDKSVKEKSIKEPSTKSKEKEKQATEKAPKQSRRSKEEKNAP
ncbi:MAG: ComEA family DNA-binding protein [Polynucleobacter victoriensis]